MQIKITTEAKGGGLAKIFTATLQNNETANALKEMLPLTLDMRDLHGNEKFFDLPKKLPTKDKNPRRIEAGDLMIWSSRTVVLFYESIATRNLAASIMPPGLPNLQPVANGLQIAEFTEVLRRLTIPHYEEARLYFKQAAQDGFFDEVNEIALYSQDTLSFIIHKYKKSCEYNNLILL